MGGQIPLSHLPMENGEEATLLSLEVLLQLSTGKTKACAGQWAWALCCHPQAALCQRGRSAPGAECPVPGQSAGPQDVSAAGRCPACPQAAEEAAWLEVPSSQPEEEQGCSRRAPQAGLGARAGEQVRLQALGTAPQSRAELRATLSCWGHQPFPSLTYNGQ